MNPHFRTGEREKVLGGGLDSLRGSKTIVNMGVGVGKKARTTTKTPHKKRHPPHKNLHKKKGTEKKNTKKILRRLNLSTGRMTVPS